MLNKELIEEDFQNKCSIKMKSQTLSGIHETVVE